MTFEAVVDDAAGASVLMRVSLKSTHARSAIVSTSVCFFNLQLCASRISGSIGECQPICCRDVTCDTSRDARLHVVKLEHFSIVDV